MESCIHCKIVSKEIEVPTILENKGALAYLTNKPCVYGHVVVTSKYHATFLTGLTKTKYNQLSDAAFLVDRVLEQVLHARPERDYRMRNNSHPHGHHLPVTKGMNVAPHEDIMSRTFPMSGTELNTLAEQLRAGATKIYQADTKKVHEEIALRMGRALLYVDSSPRYAKDILLDTANDILHSRALVSDLMSDPLLAEIMEDIATTIKIGKDEEWRGSATAMGKRIEDILKKLGMDSYYPEKLNAFRQRIS